MTRFALAALLIATACTTEEGILASKRMAPLAEAGAADSGEGVGDGADAAADAAAASREDAAGGESDAAMANAGSPAMEMAGSPAMGMAGSPSMEMAGAAAMPPVDAGMASADASVEQTDAATSDAATADAGLADAETDAEMADAATADAAMSDASMPEVDAAMADLDAAMEADASMPVTDAAMMEPDAATVDAGHMHPMPSDDDAGMDGPDPAEEHCSMEMPPDPRDSMIQSTAPVEWISETARDVLMPQPVLDWINEHGLNEAHDAWHATRRWDQTCNVSNAPAESCRFGRALVAQNLFRAEYQQGAPGAGLAFLHMHRHMLLMFKAAFPTHLELFRSWTHVPRSADDPENTMPWRELTWTADNLVGFDILENIEQHIGMFPTEDDLGNFMESTFRWTPEDPTVAKGMPGAAMHGAIHREYSVRGSPANMGSPATSLPNYTFWKLHGFIDDVWERYRAAKDLAVDDEYREIQRWECRLMYYLSPMHRQVPPPPTDTVLKRGD